MAASNWDQRYLEGRDRWELGRPAPPLEAFLRTDSRAPQPPGRVLVPGCGRGHEVALLADLGYEVIGLDFSSEAIQRTEESMVQIVLGRAPQAIGSFVGVARGEQTRFLGSNTTSRAPRKMRNSKLAVIYKKTPYSAKGSTKLHIKMTGTGSGSFR